MKTYLQKRVQSFGYAIKGIVTFFATEPHAQIHLLAIVMISALGAWLGLSATEWCLILLCMGIVLAAEGINTAIEALTDLASPDIHPLAGKAKDIAAGAVLLSVLICGLVWAIIFVPKLWGLVG